MKLIRRQDSPKQDLEIPIAENEAFLLTDAQLREKFKRRYEATAAPYYDGQPEFSEILDKIKENIHKL